MSVKQPCYTQTKMYRLRILEIHSLNHVISKIVYNEPCKRGGGGGGVYQATSGFLQKHENEIPGFFQDNSRTFFSFQGLNFIDFQEILIVFAGNGDLDLGRTSFLSPEYFHYGIDYYGTKGKLYRSTVPPRS